MGFDVSKWNKQRYLAEAGIIQEVEVDTLHDLLYKANPLYPNLAKAIAKFLKGTEEDLDSGFSKDQINDFMKVLHTELGMEPLNENFAKFDTLEMAINQHEKGAPYFDKTVLIKIFNQLSNNDQVKAKKQYSGYFSESLNEAKDEFYPDSPEALRQATQTAKEILEKNRDSIKIIADKYKGQRAKSREMMDELDALIDADLEGIAFQEYISNKVKGVLGKALFRYYASQNPELSKIMR